MAVKQIGFTHSDDIKERKEARRFTCLTADTAAWLADSENCKYGDGSTLRELNGEQRLYELQSGTWYEQ